MCHAIARSTPEWLVAPPEALELPAYNSCSQPVVETSLVLLDDFRIRIPVYSVSIITYETADVLNRYLAAIAHVVVVKPPKREFAGGCQGLFIKTILSRSSISEKVSPVDSSWTMTDIPFLV